MTMLYRGAKVTREMQLQHFKLHMGLDDTQDVEAFFNHFTLTRGPEASHDYWLHYMKPDNEAEGS